MSIVVAQHVLPLWDTMSDEHGYVTMPRLMLSTAEQLLSHMRTGLTSEQLGELARTITVEVVSGTENEPSETYTHTVIELASLAAEMDSLTGESEDSLYYPAWCAFLSAMNALREALGWKWWNGDAAKWASIAYAGGTWLEFEEQDPAWFVPHGKWDYLSPDVRARRREFWEWWHEKVIPTAWETLQESAGTLSQKLTDVQSSELRELLSAYEYLFLEPTTAPDILREFTDKNAPKEALLQSVDENTFVALLDFIRSDHIAYRDIQAKLNDCVRALEWAKHTKRQNLIAELAGVLSSYFAYACPDDLNLARDDSDQIIEAMHQFWEQGRVFAREGLAAAREMGDEDKELAFLIDLSRLSGYVDDYEMALDCMKNELRLVSHDRKWGIASAVFYLGHQANDQKEYTVARSCYQMSLTIWEKLGNKHAMADVLDFLTANEITRIERGTETGEQFSNDLLPIIDSLWELSDKLRHEAELEQEQPTTEGVLATIHDRLVDDATCKELRTTLAKLNSLG
jgi:hypothetical protein